MRTVNDRQANTKRKKNQDIMKILHILYNIHTYINTYINISSGIDLKLVFLDQTFELSRQT